MLSHCIKTPKAGKILSFKRRKTALRALTVCCALIIIFIRLCWKPRTCTLYKACKTINYTMAIWGMLSSLWWRLVMQKGQRKELYYRVNLLISWLKAAKKSRNYFVRSLCELFQSHMQGLLFRVFFFFMQTHVSSINALQLCDLF